jgi:molecular chaperone GrpE
VTEHDRDRTQATGSEDRPKVRVTDKRRVRADETAPAEAGAASAPEGSPGAGGETGRAAQDEVAEYREHLQRLQAEFANYRKRVLREQTQAIEMAAEPLVRKLLEVLDEFELALMAAERKPDFEKFHRGVELVYAKLQEALRSEGLERIEAEGREFDPEEHEALMGSAGGDGEPVVADVFRQGYKLRGRVIRPAGVRVAHPDEGSGGSRSEREGASGSPQDEGSGGSRSEREGASGSPQDEGSGGSRSERQGEREGASDRPQGDES